jgi:hypothetical protein
MGLLESVFRGIWRWGMFPLVVVFSALYISFYLYISAFLSIFNVLYSAILALLLLNVN